MPILDTPMVLVQMDGSDELRDICELLPRCPDCQNQLKYVAKDEYAMYFACPLCGHTIDLDIYQEEGGDDCAESKISSTTH